MRARLTTSLELTGLALIAAGSFLAFAPAGLVVAGLALLFVGFQEGRR